MFLTGRKSKASSIENAKDLLTNVKGRVIRNNSSDRKTQQYYTTLERPKVTTVSKYTFAWETYIAANLHLYIIPLSIFLRRAREFDFSKEGFKNAIGYVRKVLRVFSPDVVKTLEKLLSHRISPGNQSSETSKEMYAIFQSHENILGKFRPPRKDDWSLEMLQEDMHALLEEISLQHRKTISEQDVIDRLGSTIQGLFFNEGLHAEERMIQTLVQNAKIIVNFPDEYEVFPNGKGQGDVSSWNAASQQSDSTNSPEREQSGQITDTGRSQLLEGSKIFNPMDVAFIGDPMYARVKDYEMAALVKLAIYISDWLNVNFGFVSKSNTHLHGNEEETDLANLLKEQDEIRGTKYRINLRFIADTRNWLFILITVKMLQWIF